MNENLDGDEPVMGTANGELPAIFSVEGGVFIFPKGLSNFAEKSGADLICIEGSEIFIHTVGSDGWRGLATTADRPKLTPVT